MYAKIHNPKTNRNVSIYSPLGKKILKSYLSKSGLLGGTGQTGQTGLTEGLTDDQARAIETLNLLKQKGLHVSVAKQVSRINLPSRFNVGDRVDILPDHRIERLRGRRARIISMEPVPMYEQDESFLSGQDPVGNYGRYNYKAVLLTSPRQEVVTLKEGEFWFWGRGAHGTTGSTSFGVPLAVRVDRQARLDNDYRTNHRSFAGIPSSDPPPRLNSTYYHPRIPLVSEIARDSTGTPLLLEDSIRMVGERERVPYHETDYVSIPERERQPYGG